MSFRCIVCHKMIVYKRWKKKIRKDGVVEAYPFISAHGLLSERKMNVKKKPFRPILIDSNFLFIPSQFQLDVFEEIGKLLSQQFDPVLLSPTKNELQEITKKGSPKMRRQASLALKFAEKCRVVRVEKDLKETHDDVIVRVAAEWRCPVATNDRELRKRLRNIGIPVIFLRQRSRLELEGTV